MKVLFYAIILTSMTTTILMNTLGKKIKKLKAANNHCSCQDKNYECN